MNDYYALYMLCPIVVILVIEVVSWHKTRVAPVSPVFTMVATTLLHYMTVYVVFSTKLYQSGWAYVYLHLKLFMFAMMVMMVMGLSGYISSIVTQQARTGFIRTALRVLAFSFLFVWVANVFGSLVAWMIFI